MTFRTKVYSRLFVFVILPILCLLLPTVALAQSSSIASFPAVGGYNGYLNQLNVVECANADTQDVTLTLDLIRNSGAPLAAISRVISANGGSQHIILNDIKDASGIGIKDDYGLVKFSTSKTGALVSCLITYYRLDGSRVEYAYAIPLTNSQKGASYGIYNSFDPGLGTRPTDNWLTIYNPSNTSFSAQINTRERNSTGAIEVATAEVTLQPLERRDVYLGRPGIQSTGLYEIKPANNNSLYGSFLNRYHQKDSGQYDFAFSLASLTGNSCGERLNASTMGNALNWLEIANPSAQDTNVTLEVRNREGVVVHTQAVGVSQWGQSHVLLNPYIDPNGTGNVGSARVLCASKSQKMIVQSAFYGRTAASTNTIDWAYVSQAKGSLYAGAGARVVGLLNTFVRSANWLKLNNASDANIQFAYSGLNTGSASVFQSSSAIPAYGTSDLGIHELVGSDFAGTVSLISTTKDIAYKGEILRVYLNDKGGIDYIMPTPLGILNGGLTTTPDEDRPVVDSQTITVNERSAINFTLTGRDPNNRGITFSIVSPPGTGTLSGSIPNLRFTAAFARTERLTFKANNGRYDSLPGTITINVPSAGGQFRGNSSSLEPYRNSLTPAEWGHLFRHASLGSSRQLLSKASTLDELLDAMIAGTDNNASEDSALALANPLKNPHCRLVVVDAATNRKISFCTDPNDFSKWNYDAIRNYWLYHMRFGHALKERMALILADVFSVNMAMMNGSRDYNTFIKSYLDLVRSHALSRPNGPSNTQGYDQLALKMISEPAMLLWLDNRLNSYQTPNQNFARELQELFTLGARDPVNFQTNFSEADVAAATTAMGGWTLKSVASRDVMYYSSEPGFPPSPQAANTYAGVYDPSRWMPDPNRPLDIEIYKGLPAYAKSGFNYQSLLNHIMYSHRGAARSVAARLFSALAHPEPTEAIINELANDLVTRQYDLSYVVRKILRSSAMFSSKAQYACVASPSEAFLNMFRGLDLPLNQNGNDLYMYLRNALNLSGEPLLAPPTVFGFKGCIGPRNSVIYRGENWLAPLPVLQRERQLIYILNRLSDNAKTTDFRWLQFIPPANTVAAPYSVNYPKAIVDYIATKLGLDLNQQEKDVLVRYLKTVKITSTATPYDVSSAWDPASSSFESIVNQKVPGLIQILFTHTKYNLR